MRVTLRSAKAGAVRDVLHADGGRPRGRLRGNHADHHRTTTEGALGAVAIAARPAGAVVAGRAVLVIAAGTGAVTAGRTASAARAVVKFAARALVAGGIWRND